MSREMKFRFWDTFRKWMITMPDAPFTEGKDLAAFFEQYKEYEGNNLVLMQSSEVRIGGVEMFEGDIVRHVQGEQQNPESEFEYIGVVKFHRGSFFIQTNNARFSEIHVHDIDGIGQVTRVWHGSYNKGNIYEIAKDFKVIGNVFENSELLNQQTA